MMEKKHADGSVSVGILEDMREEPKEKAEPKPKKTTKKK